MPKLTIVAHIYANADKVELVKSSLETLIPTTRAEEGCLQYDLHQDNDNPVHFMFFENWESRELWQVHIKAPHIQAHRTRTEGAIENFVVHEMTHIAV